jgi:hypothetical protein
MITIHFVFIHSKHNSLSGSRKGGLVGRIRIDSPAGKIMLSLDLGSHTFKWKHRSNVILSETPFYQKDFNELMLEISGFLEMTGMDIQRVNQPIHYQIPDYGIESIGEGEISARGMEEWIYYRELANTACYNTLGYLQSESEVRIWPHHFDTGIYTIVTKQLGLGFGMAMEDAMVGQPYFYLAGYEDAAPKVYEGLPDLSSGQWDIGGHWKGAVLPLVELPNDSFISALIRIRKFCEESTTWYLKNLDSSDGKQTNLA